MPNMNISLGTIASDVKRDPGLIANISKADINGGAAAAILMNEVIEAALAATGVNNDGRISPDDARKISDYIRDNPDLYAKFVEGHGDDEGNEETGFHLVQGDGGTLRFQGRDFVNTVADAIYHVGFTYKNGRFRNEDGNANETVDDVAGWMNYYVNGENVVYGTGRRDVLYTGDYSDGFEDAKNEVFMAGAGNDDVWAGDGDDEIWTGAGNDNSGGGAGDDIMMGEGGHDKLWGNAGNDTIDGGDGNDTIGGHEGDDDISGGNGNDKIWAGDGKDVVDAGDGRDTVGGGAGDDVIDGGAGHDKLWGEAGDDDITGGAGNDTIGGGDGDDAIDAGDGNDKVYSGSGDDEIDAGDGRDTVWAGDGNDSVSGGAGRDKIGGDDGNDTINAGADNDIVYAGAGMDTVNGDSGNDVIYGHGEDDILNGGAGNDIVIGGDGQDTIIGGTGKDILRDWEDVDARDTFVFSTGDTGTNRSTMDIIEGFDVNQDVIDLTGFGGLSFVEDFSGGGAGEVLFDGKYVRIDADGDGTFDAGIEVRWVSDMTASDFVL